MHDSRVLPHWSRTSMRRGDAPWVRFVDALGLIVGGRRLLGRQRLVPESEQQTPGGARGVRLYLVLLVAVALLPLTTPKAHSVAADTPPFPGWPALEPGTVLAELPLTDVELGFARSFPGKIGKFGDKHRSYVVRWVTTPTRRLHPAEDCYRASGFTIHHHSRCPAETAVGSGCFTAVRNGAKLLVQERITDKAGNTFSDVSSWYWAAVRGVSAGPWWSITKVTAQ